MRIEYNCNGYHRYGREHCSAHRIDETTLDKLIYDELLLIKGIARENWKSIEIDIKKWMNQKNNFDRKIKELESHLAKRQSELEGIILDRIHDRECHELYTAMLEKCEADIKSIKKQLEDIRDFDTTIKKRKAEMKQNIDLIDEIVSAGAVSDTHLRMLIDEIEIFEQDNKLKINIGLKAMFRMHQDYYNDEGEITDRIFETWHYPAW